MTKFRSPKKITIDQVDLSNIPIASDINDAVLPDRLFDCIFTAVNEAEDNDDFSGIEDIYEAISNHHDPLLKALVIGCIYSIAVGSYTIEQLSELVKVIPINQETRFYHDEMGPESGIVRYCHTLVELARFEENEELILALNKMYAADDSSGTKKH